MAWPPPERPRLRALAWLGALLLMLTMLAGPPVQRTQEARVLETAREMLGHGWHDWLIPHLNGRIRLEKPPLAYWLAAAAFKIGGVNEGAGRVPFVLVGWATLIITWSTARRLFGGRAAFYAAATLLGGMMFARHARLAETDILATCFVTAAIACLFRGSEEGSSPLWLSLSGVMIGLAILAKGPPAVFALIFLLAFAGATKDWRIVLRWFASGAPLFAAAIAGPWFLYVKSTIGLRTMQDEVEIGVRGMEHTGTFLQYIPDTLRGVAPWTALTILGIVLAIRWREDARLRGAVVWFGAIIVPLCFGGQRQFHYLFPAMPALAVLTGWMIDRMLERDVPQWELARMLFVASVIVMLTAALALPIIGWKVRGGVLPVDWLAMALCAMSAATSLLLLRGPLARATFAFAIAAAVGMTVLTQAWMPSLRHSNPRDIAAAVRALGPGPYCFYGEKLSLPLVFYMKQVMPQILTAQELSAAAEQNPDLIVIAQSKSGVSPPPVPQGLERAAEINSDDQTFELYRVRR